jgi:hypothetical protein
MIHRRQFMFGAACGALILPAASARAEEKILRMRDLYNKDGTFSDFALENEGERMAVQGFMAPPLKADSTFFVLTKRPMSVCPFCETSADWPDDILAIYTKRVYRVEPFNVRIVTRGTLELGEFRDPETGFLSLVRLAGSTFERA